MGEGEIKAISQTLVNGLRVLEALADLGGGRRPVSLSELAAATGFDRSTTHRHIGALRLLDYVTIDPTTGGYRLGFKLLYLASHLLENLDLRRLARPHLQALADATEETVFLVQRKGIEVVYIDRIDSNKSVRLASSIGGRNPLYCTGVGKAILAYEEPEVFDQVVAAGLTPRTPNTITDVVQLQAEMRVTRERGYSIDNVENEPEVRCVGAPVFDHLGHPIGAVSIAGPVTRMLPERLPELGKLVRSAADGISRQLGYRG
ncbi:MAG: IclR family transcriptional regulator [Limnochordaceae bacterium]|nr:IclR family transcriptional regulator [Limnochordaceae bacterium]